MFEWMKHHRTWHDKWHDTTWHDMTSHDTTSHDMTWIKNEWMNDWMNGWLYEWRTWIKDEWMDEWHEWMNEWMNDEWMNEWVNEWVKNDVSENTSGVELIWAYGWPSCSRKKLIWLKSGTNSWKLRKTTYFFRFPFFTTNKFARSRNVTEHQRTSLKPTMTDLKMTPNHTGNPMVREPVM